MGKDCHLSQEELTLWVTVDDSCVRTTRRVVFLLPEPGQLVMKGPDPRVGEIQGQGAGLCQRSSCGSQAGWRLFTGNTDQGY